MQISGEATNHSSDDSPFQGKKSCKTALKNPLYHITATSKAVYARNNDIKIARFPISLAVKSF
jgi:hypothetical protein